jgi:glutamate-ammonia-ligase adenylyltransferase
MSTLPAEFSRQIPALLHAPVSLTWQSWSQACEAAGLESQFTPELAAMLGKLWACSEFSARLCERKPEMLHALLAEGVENRRGLADYSHLVTDAIAQSTTGVGDPVAAEKGLMQGLRVLRQREMLRIALRDIGGLAELEQIMRELSELAEAMVAETLDYLQAQACAQFGEPLDADGNVQTLLVLAMGKLGGHELNFSSDIDLIFCYAEDGQTHGGRSTSIHEFFVRQAQKLIRVLNEVSADGFVFRVDARLRPHGESGPLVISFAGMEQYYQSQGRDWERYAMVKARAVAGRAADIAYLDALLKPFVYRRYLDYSAIAAIREMKALIEAEVVRRGIAENIKLGRGGIREIEFIGQTFQLMRGGRDRSLQQRGILQVLPELVKLHCLSPQESEQLVQSYRFLRRLENRIQMLRDQQTHVVPDNELDRARLACAMAAADWPELAGEIDSQRAQVNAIFRSIVPASTTAPAAESGNLLVLQQFWLDQQSSERLRQWLAELGYSDPDRALAQLTGFVAHAQIRQLNEAATGRLQRLLSNLLPEITVAAEPEALLDRVLDLLRAIVGRTVYINLLLEYPGVREQLLKLCSASDWFARQLISQPLLLDELLDVNELYRVATRAELAAELDSVLALLPAHDLEQHMERLRQFRNAQLLRTAAQDISAVIDVMGVGDVLSALAEEILARTLQLAWQEMVQRYGEPRCEVDGVIQQPGIAVIGYGKLGGYELGYSSDLDIVFLHNSRGEDEMTSGEKSIDNSDFFARVAQRALHILGTRSYAGLLYEIDTRLRPEGRAGLMVSSIAGFAAYQRDKAWTWEHQALIRARGVAGDHHVREEFARIRHSVLAVKRELGPVLHEVAEMRSKMRQHLASNSDQGVDLKQDAGGIVDIEFIVQAGVLLRAVDHPDLLATTSTLVLLPRLATCGWLLGEEVEVLSAAYKLYRQQLNRQALQALTPEQGLSESEVYRERVTAVWQRLFAAQEPAA